MFYDIMQITIISIAALIAIIYPILFTASP